MTSATPEHPARDGVTPVLLSWSGGKDAAWTLHALRQRRDVAVVGLLATVTRGSSGRASMQAIRVDVLQAQAAAAALPLMVVPIPARADNAAYETCFAAALVDAATRWPGLRTLAFGDLFLADIRAWREALCARLGWSALFPLFGADTAALADAMLAGGLRARVCSVDTTLLDAAFAGRAFDASLLAALPPGVDRCGERGEFHTCVHDGPMFDAPLGLLPAGRTLRDGRFAEQDFALAATGGSPTH